MKVLLRAPAGVADGGMCAIIRHTFHRQRGAAPAICRQLPFFYFFYSQKTLNRRINIDIIRSLLLKIVEILGIILLSACQRKRWFQWVSLIAILTYTTQIKRRIFYEKVT